MAETQLNIVLLESTADAVNLIYAACRQCYSPDFAGNLMESDVSQEKKEKFIRGVVASGHESPMEHVKFTFAVEGVSRALTHQLVRHRIASYSQQSQRYVGEEDFDFIVPPMFKKDPDMEMVFLDMMKTIQQGYNDLIAKFA